MEVRFSDGETEAPKVSASQSYGEQSISEKKLPSLARVEDTGQTSIYSVARSGWIKTPIGT